jgi:hypothetical protein
VRRLRLFSILILAATLGGLSPRPANAGWHPAPSVAPGETPLTILAGPMGWAFHLASFVVAPRGPKLSESIAREDGRRILSFPIGESAAGLFVRISGRVEFERADIGFPDGSVQSVDAYGLHRDSGTYALADFDNDRAVSWVRLIVRARSRSARVGVLVGR